MGLHTLDEAFVGDAVFFLVGGFQAGEHVEFEPFEFAGRKAVAAHPFVLCQDGFQRLRFTVGFGGHGNVVGIVAAHKAAKTDTASEERRIGLLHQFTDASPDHAVAQRDKQIAFQILMRLLLIPGNIVVMLTEDCCTSLSVARQ